MPLDTECVYNLQFWKEKKSKTGPDQTTTTITVYARISFESTHFCAERLGVKLNCRWYTLVWLEHTTCIPYSAYVCRVRLKNRNHSYCYRNGMLERATLEKHKKQTTAATITTTIASTPPSITLLFKWLYNMISCFSIWCIIYCSTTIQQMHLACVDVEHLGRVLRCTPFHKEIIQFYYGKKLIRARLHRHTLTHMPHSSFRNIETKLWFIDFERQYVIMLLVKKFNRANLIWLCMGFGQRTVNTEWVSVCATDGVRLNISKRSFVHAHFNPLRSFHINLKANTFYVHSNAHHSPHEQVKSFVNRYYFTRNNIVFQVIAS